MGGAHARSMKALGDRAVITAICEKNPEIYNRVDGWVRPETKFYTDFDEFIHSGIDAVILANYFHEHAYSSWKHMKNMAVNILWL